MRLFVKRSCKKNVANLSSKHCDSDIEDGKINTPGFLPNGNQKRFGKIVFFIYFQILFSTIYLLLLKIATVNS